MSRSDKEGLSQLDFLIGSWSGHGKGFGHTSKVWNTYQYVLQDKFIQSQAESIARDDSGEVIEFHEDMGIFSYDPDREAIILREFYTEGYVNEYVVEAVSGSEGSYIYRGEKSEGSGGLRAQLRLNLISDDEYEMYLDLARPGEDFRECQEIHMFRESPDTAGPVTGDKRPSS